MRAVMWIALAVGAVLAGCGESQGAGGGATDSPSEAQAPAHMADARTDAQRHAIADANAAKGLFTPRPCDAKQAASEAEIWAMPDQAGRRVVLSNTFDAALRRRKIVFDLQAVEATVGEPALNEWAWVFDCGAPTGEKAARLAFQAAGSDGRTLEFDRAALDRIESWGDPDSLAGVQPATVMPVSASAQPMAATPSPSDAVPAAAPPTSGEQPAD